MDIGHIKHSVSFAKHHFGGLFGDACYMAAMRCKVDQAVAIAQGIAEVVCHRKSWGLADAMEDRASADDDVDYVSIERRPRQCANLSCRWEETEFRRNTRVK